MSRIPSSIAGGHRPRQQPSQSTIIETNASRCERPISWKCRWLDGWAGIYNQSNYTLNDFLGVAKYGVPQQPQMHWALRVGPYLYELITVDNMGIEWRYVDETRAESWTSQVPEKIVGETSATDTELANMAETVISRMRRSGQTAFAPTPNPPAKYHLIKNNCHTFALCLLQDILCFDIGVPDVFPSPAFAGLWKMQAVSSHRNVKDLYGSPSSYARALKDTWTGKLRERHFGESLPDYQRGAVRDEEFRRQMSMAGVQFR